MTPSRCGTSKAQPFTCVSPGQWLGWPIPLSHQALLPGSAGGVTSVEGLGISVSVGGENATPMGSLTWKDWTATPYETRLKAGARTLRDAFVGEA